MSIKPIYAKLIKSGQKTVELRRTAPKVSTGDVLVIYESAPVQRITSYCEIDAVITAEPNKLWDMVYDDVGLSRNMFLEYFEGKTSAAGIKLGNLHMLTSPKALSSISEDMRAPQSYRYLTQEQFEIITQ